MSRFADDYEWRCGDCGARLDPTEGACRACGSTRVVRFRRY